MNLFYPIILYYSLELSRANYFRPRYSLGLVVRVARAINYRLQNFQRRTAVVKVLIVTQAFIMQQFKHTVERILI